jgi:hypothetical protein
MAIVGGEAIVGGTRSCLQLSGSSWLHGSSRLDDVSAWLNYGSSWLDDGSLWLDGSSWLNDGRSWLDGQCELLA